RFGGRRGRYGGQIEGVRPQIVGGAGVLLDVKVRGHAAPPPGVTPCGTSLRHASSFAVPTWGFLAVTGHPPGVTPCGTSLRHASSFAVPTWGFLAVTPARPGRRGSPPRSSVPPYRAACRCGGRWRRQTCGLPCRRTGGSSHR